MALGSSGITVLSKRERHFERVAEFKDRFRPLPTETIRRRLNIGILQTEAAIALRELLEERDPGALPQADEAADA